MSTGGPTGQQLPVDPLGLALGVQFEPFPISAAEGTPAAPTSQTVYASAVYATAGASITGVKIRNNAAAAGTLPTTARFGLADNTGKILALSGNVNALANWPTQVCPMPFAAPFTLAYSGVYFPCFVVNGAWGTTQPTPILAAVGGANAAGADGANPPPVFLWTGQADLPAVGSSLTISGLTNRVYYLALY